jgi:hypothetical protein
MQFCTAHRKLQPHTSSVRKITGSPRLQKKSSAAPKVYLGSMRRWELAHNRGGPRGARNRGCVRQRVALAGRHGQGTRGIPPTRAPPLWPYHSASARPHSPATRPGARVERPSESSGRPDNSDSIQKRFNILKMPEKLQYQRLQIVCCQVEDSGTQFAFSSTSNRRKLGPRKRQKQIFVNSVTNKRNP